MDKKDRNIWFNQRKKEDKEEKQEQNIEYEEGSRAAAKMQGLTLIK
ncbi:hypothetical protein [Peribacillus frigoritolerans]